METLQISASNPTEATVLGSNASQPLVSIITVDYRQPVVTCELLDSIAKLAYPSLETIVVDNGALADNTATYQSHLPDVQVIVSKDNLGFAGGNNLGIRCAKGDFIFLVNNDTVIPMGLSKPWWPAAKCPKLAQPAPKSSTSTNRTPSNMRALRR